MTWQNALFNVVGVALLGLGAWGHHRFDLWFDERRRERAARRADRG